MAIAGKVAITPKGEWNANTAYTKLDLVFYENASYVAIQPSTGVEPTNTSYWMLVVQSAGGADLEAIINGSTQVGNAKTLDGHEAEYFFPSSGGIINGDVTVEKTSNGANVSKYLKNLVREIREHIGGSGVYRLHDVTNGKDIITSNLDGTNTFNGTASGNVPLDGGGEVTKAFAVPFKIKNTIGNSAYINYSGKDGVLGSLGMGGENIPVYLDKDGNTKTLLHTGNKPTGTYTGNGSATSRQIATNGFSNAICIFGGGAWAIITPQGGVGASANGGALTVYSKAEANFSGGVLNLATASSIINDNGVTHSYHVL